MKKYFVLMATVLVIMSAQMAVADQIQMGYSGGSSYGPYQSGSGGEFTYTIISGLTGVLDNYNAVAKNVGGSTNTFQSFCIEHNEYIYPNPSVYDVVLNDAAVNGGAGGPNPDPLSRGAAFLYSQFINGQLTGYDYNGGGRNTSAGNLQNLIWWLEDEITADQSLNPFYTLLINQFGSGSIAKDNNLVNGQRQYQVMVMNMWVPGHVGENDYRRQDQLVGVPEPAILLLLGAGLIGFAAIGRKGVKKLS